MSDKATLAYAAITAQLSQFDDDMNDNHPSTTTGNRTSTSLYGNDDNIMGGYGDDDNDDGDDGDFDINMDMEVELDNSFLSSRSQLTSNTHANANANTNRFSTFSATSATENANTSSTNFLNMSTNSGAGASIATGRDSHISAMSMGGMSGTFGTSDTPLSGLNERKISFGYSNSPISTPAITKHQQMQQQQQQQRQISEESQGTAAAAASDQLDTTNYNQEEYETDAEGMNMNMNIIQKEEKQITYEYAESLDGDYRPYYEALDSFLVNSSTATPSPSTDNHDNHDHDNKLKVKDAQLQYMNRIMRSNYDRSSLLQSHDDGMEYVTTTRSLEKEGHFWSLLIQLFDSTSPTSSSTTTTTTNGVEKDDFLLWNDRNTNTDTKGTTASNTMIQKFITKVIEENVNIDPAAMVQLIQSYFEEEDDDDDDEDEQLKVPSIIIRRQTILEWIESCHMRSILGFKIGNQNHIMWNDTVTNFQNGRVSSNSSNNNNGKITSFHPDAPLVTKMNKKSNSTIDPLYGNDGANEMYLLSTCLSLIKAGRFVDALDVCREFGQPWRASTWDGNGPHGYQTVMVDDQDYDNDTMEVDENNDNNNNNNNHQTKQILIGNPNRPLWKRALWEASQSMHSMLSSSSSTSTEKQMIASGSLVYEAAITSVLADDVTTALKNPVLKRNWMDLVWVYYRGKQSRFMEQVYCTHNNAKRSLDVASDFPIEGTEYEEEEKEQLASTEEIHSTDDSVFLRSLEQEYGRKVVDNDDDDSPWRPGMCAFLSGKSDVQSFLIQTIKSILESAEESKETNGEDGRDTFLHEQEVLLRFIFHLVLLLDSLTSDNENLIDFHENAIAPYRDDLLLLYLQRLMMHRPLWRFTCLYASLLPMEAMVDSLTGFWMSSIHDDNDRRMVLNQAREFLSEGLDLVILRKVVRASIDVPSDQQLTTTNSKLLPITTMKRLMTSNNRGLEQKVSHDDLLKIHSIRWLCIYDEHYADALVCVNMLLRQLLLHVDENQEDEEIGDWSEDTKLRTAKLFKARLLPQDLLNKAMNGGGFLEVDDTDETSGNKMCTEEFHSYYQEFEAIGDFLEAHSMYEAWKKAIVSLPAAIQFHKDGNFAEGSLESEIAIKMGKRNYIQKKRKNGIALVQVAEASYQSMMKVLTCESGFLSSDSTEPGIIHSVDEMRKRSTELNSLRSKCLPLAVFLTYRVLTETAHWMNEFVEDIMTLFQDEAADILSRIHMVQDDDESLSPFLPESWHAKASYLGEIMDEDKSILGCFDDDDIEYFQSLMTETATNLKNCEERKI